LSDVRLHHYLATETVNVASYAASGTDFSLCFLATDHRLKSVLLVSLRRS